MAQQRRRQTVLSPEMEQQGPPKLETCEGCDPKGRGDAHSQPVDQIECNENRGCLLHKHAGARRGQIVLARSGMNSLVTEFDDDAPFLICRKRGDLCLESKCISRELECVLWRLGSQLFFCVQAGWNKNILVGGKPVDLLEWKQLDLNTTIYFGGGCKYTLCQACPGCAYELEGPSQAMATGEATRQVQHVPNLSCKHHTPQKRKTPDQVSEHETRLFTKRQRSDV